MVDILFTLGDWDICHDPSELELYTKHDNCASGPYLHSWYVDETPCVCVHCGMTVPDEIQALMLMLATELKS